MDKKSSGADAPYNAITNQYSGLSVNKSFGANPSEFFEGQTFVPKWLADRMMLDYSFKTIRETDEIFVYREGVYTDTGESIIESVAQARLGSQSNNRRVNEVVGHIRRATRCDQSEFDSDPNIINLENGMFNIDLMEIFPHTPDYLSLRKIPITFDPDATCPCISRFLEEVLQKEDIVFMTEMFGYALMTIKRMNTAMFLEGNGRNGKSTLIDLFTAFIGKDLCAEITPTQMRNEDRFAIMDLYGKLVNKIDDLGDVTLKDLGRFKSVVDSKSVRGEIKFKKSMSFKPHVLCIFACNDVPLSEDTSDGYYSRIRVISFLNRFVGTNENLNKIDELATQSELAGLFNASISAAKKAITNNAFSGGKTIADKQRDYVYASNSIARFVDEMCDISDLDSYIQKEELYNQYILWARDNKHRIKEKGRMTQYLDSLGIMVRQLTIDNERIRIYSGIDMDEHDR